MEDPRQAERYGLAAAAIDEPNTSHTVMSSEFHRFADGVACVLGIDEAGRGPVLGPMVYGCAVARLQDEAKLKETGVTDSKAVTEEKRERLLEQFEKGESSDGDALVAFIVRVISPLRLSICMQQRSKLNDESHQSAIRLIQLCVDKGVNVQAVYIDTVGPPESYQNMLQSKFPQLNITVSKKADSIYPIVGAASIAAKVTRDACVTKWQFPEEKCDPTLSIKVPESGWGSGYPGDPQTKSFIKCGMDRVFGYPSFVRFSWKTCSEALDKGEGVAKVFWEDDGEQNDPKSKSVKSHSLQSFFPLKEQNDPDGAGVSSKKRRCIFFDTCKLKNFDGDL